MGNTGSRRYRGGKEVSLHDVYMAQQAIEKDIDWVLKSLDSLELTDEDDAELDRITTPLCARSSELEEWIKARKNK